MIFFRYVQIYSFTDNKQQKLRLIIRKGIRLLIKHET